jgi:hypothetical protein
VIKFSNAPSVLAAALLLISVPTSVPASGSRNFSDMLIHRYWCSGACRGQFNVETARRRLEEPTRLIVDLQTFPNIALPGSRGTDKIELIVRGKLLNVQRGSWGGSRDDLSVAGA